MKAFSMQVERIYDQEIQITINMKGSFSGWRKMITGGNSDLQKEQRIPEMLSICSVCCALLGSCNRARHRSYPIKGKREIRQTDKLGCSV